MNGTELTVPSGWCTNRPTRWVAAPSNRRFVQGTGAYVGVVATLLVASFVTEFTIGPVLYGAVVVLMLPVGAVIVAALWVNAIVVSVLARALGLAAAPEEYLTLVGVTMTFVVVAVANALAVRELWRAGRSLSGRRLKTGGRRGNHTVTVVLPDQVIAQILRALRDCVSSGVVIERVGRAGLAVRAPWSTGRDCSGSMEFMAFRVPRTRLPFRPPPTITLAGLAERYQCCIDCVDTVAEHTPRTWQADLIGPLTSHVDVSDDRVTAWVTDERGTRLDLPALTTGVGDVTGA